MAIRKKKISTSFSVILILLALIAGGYVYKIFTRNKAKAATIYTAAIHPHKKHKIKHRPKKHSTLPIPSPDTAKIVVVKPAAVKSIPAAMQTTITPVTVKPSADTTPLTIARQNSPYTTYVQPNVTGIVKMRAEDKYYSSIIADIPANAKVLVLQRGDTYYRVNYNNSIGYIPKWSLHVK
jgi:hypothetical protein